MGSRSRAIVGPREWGGGEDLKPPGAGIRISTDLKEDAGKGGR